MQNSLDAQEVEQAMQPRSDESFREVFATHRVGLFRLAVLLVGDVHAAEEITAEVFARVLPKWRAGVVLEPLPYIRRAVVNETRSRHRRRRSELRALTRLGTRAAIGHQPDRLELAEPLFAALKRLPVRQRAVVVLRFHDDVSEAEVARTLGIAVGSVKSQASRGLAELRRLLEDQR